MIHGLAYYVHLKCKSADSTTTSGRVRAHATRFLACTRVKVSTAYPSSCMAASKAR